MRIKVDAASRRVAKMLLVRGGRLRLPERIKVVRGIGIRIMHAVLWR